MTTRIYVRSLHRDGHVFQRAEIFVISVLLAGKDRMERMVDVIAPLSIETIAAHLRRANDPRIVQVALGDKNKMPPEMCFQINNFGRQLFQKRNGRSVDDCVHGIQAQSVDVIVAEPHDCVVAKKAAHFVAVGPVEIKCRTPRRRVTIGKIRTKLRKIVAAWAQMVVDDVEQYG